MINKIKVTSTSNVTADCTPIILNETDRLQLMFEASIIDNFKNKENSVSGTLIYRKKKVSDQEFPLEIASKKNVKVGEILKISLDTSETKRLFEGLQEIYELSKKMDGIQFGTFEFVKVDNTLEQVISNISALEDDSKVDFLKRLLNLYSNITEYEAFSKIFSDITESNLSIFTRNINLENLNRVISNIENNLSNDQEEYWQNLFTENHWVLSHLIGLPIIYTTEKAYVGGKNFLNKEGLICDYLYQNKLTNNSVLIELKNPLTKIIKSKYRSTYCFSEELTGGVNQLLKYQDTFIKTYGPKDDKKIKVFSPNGILIIGKVSNLNEQELEAFELFRSSLHKIQIITFDEILEKIKSFQKVLLNDI